MRRPADAIRECSNLADAVDGRLTDRELDALECVLAEVRLLAADGRIVLNALAAYLADGRKRKGLRESGQRLHDRIDRLT